MKPHIKFHLDKDLFLAILVSITGSLIALTMFFLSGYMVTQSALGMPIYALMILVVSVKLFGFLRAITRYVERLLSHRTTFTMLRNIRVQFVKQLFPRVPNIYRKFRSSDLISRMVNKVESLQNIYLRVYYPPFVIGLTALIAAVALIYFSIAHAILIVISMLFYLWIIPWLSAKRVRILKQQVTTHEQKMLAEFYDYKAGYQELITFNQQDAYKKKVVKSLEYYDRLQAKENRFLTFYDYILNLISIVTIFLSLALAVIQIEHGYLDVIYVTSMILMILTLFEQAIPMSNFAYYKADTDQALTDINEVFNSSITTPKLNVQTKQEPVFSISNLNFKYFNQETLVLNDINLTIHKGERVAIIGPSGSGKSTLMQLLCGLYETEEGSVELYGQPITQINENDRYNEINALLQSQQIFDGTVRENLLSNQKDENLIDVLNMLNLSYLNLNTQLTLDGTSLSGGEIQRLSLARLFLKSSNIWLLDEPTTALDEDNTNNVMKEINKRAETLVVATHDLDLLPYFDTIIVMVEGEVVEYGDYVSLSQNKGYLNRMIHINTL